jgi:hypothetical protein
MSHMVEYEYEYCPSGGVRVRKAKGKQLICDFKTWVKTRYR